MSTMEAPTLAQFFSMRLAARRTRVAREAIARTWLQSLVRLTLHLAGFSGLTIAGFLWDMKAGFVIAGISCFVMSSLIAPNTDVVQSDPMARRRA